MGGLTETPEEYMRSLGLDPSIMGRDFLDAFYAAIKAGDSELAEDLFYRLTDAIDMQEGGMNGLTIKGKEFVVELADMVERASELQKNLDKAAKYFNRTDEGLSDAEYQQMLIYQQYGESRTKGAKTKPRKARKGRDPVNAKDYAEQLVRQVALEQRLIGMSQEQADFANIMFDLKERNKKADIKLSEQQMQSYANQIAKVKEVIREQQELQKKYEELGNTIAGHLEDAMMSFVDHTKSAEEKFKEFASAVIQDLYRILIVQEMVNAAKSAMTGGNFFSSLFGGGKADGGPVKGGTTYLVGERGPELFTPASNGNIVPNHELGGGTTIVQNINISTGVQQTVRAEIRQMMPVIAESAKSAVADSKRRGGNYGRAMA